MCMLQVPNVVLEVKYIEAIYWLTTIGLLHICFNYFPCNEHIRLKCNTEL